MILEDILGQRSDVKGCDARHLCIVIPPESENEMPQYDNFRHVARQPGASLCSQLVKCQAIKSDNNCEFL